MIDTQEALAASRGTAGGTGRQQLAGLPSGGQRIENDGTRPSRSNRLYSRGDPLGLAALLRDLAAIETHLKGVASSADRRPKASGECCWKNVQALDPATWIVLGDPRIVEGISNPAPGGWGKYCGIATRQAFVLDDDRPLVVELELTPLTMGFDSQLVASATETGGLLPILVLRVDNTSASTRKARSARRGGRTRSPAGSHGRPARRSRSTRPTG